MTETGAVTIDDSVESSLLFLNGAFGKLHPLNFTVRLWNGAEWGAEEAQKKKFTLVLKHPGALRRMFLPLNELKLGEAYIFEDFESKGISKALLPLPTIFLLLLWGRKTGHGSAGVF